MVIAKFDRYDMINNPCDDTAAFTIWFSGCNFKCENCQNPVLWDSNYGTEYNWRKIADIAISVCKTYNMKYVVLLGGEPLQQFKTELVLLCDALKEAGINIWLYTGYDIDDVPNEIKKTLYTIKCGRYIDSLKQDGFPASSNQRVYRNIAGDLVDITEQFRRLVD